MSITIIFIIAVIITEGLVEVLSKSEIFSPVRKWFFKRRENRVFNFIHSLLDCGYCLSVWVGTFVGLLLVDLPIVHPALDWFIVGLLLHRLSNLWHNIIDRTRHDL
jgi:hypothetical protein